MNVHTKLWFRWLWLSEILSFFETSSSKKEDHISVCILASTPPRNWWLTQLVEWAYRFFMCCVLNSKATRLTVLVTRNKNKNFPGLFYSVKFHFYGGCKGWSSPSFLLACFKIQFHGAGLCFFQNLLYSSWKCTQLGSSNLVKLLLYSSPRKPMLETHLVLGRVSAVLEHWLVPFEISTVC